MMPSSIHRKNAAATSGPRKPGVATVHSVTNHSAAGPHVAAWIDSGAWRLPSGKALSEFALQAGFLAPHLFAAEGSSPLIGMPVLARESGKRAH
jgi:hypothetical protein